MVEAITTNETHFFREPKHFEFMGQEVLPRWRAQAEQQRRSRTIRIWSAGCSSGEEPYSLAMFLANELPDVDCWDIQILATDISSRVLAMACRGVYSMAKSADIPKPILHRFMLKGIAGQQGQMKVTGEIQRMVQFSWANLSQGPYPIGIAFDLIFCRNVLIYFDDDSKRKVVDNLANCLSADGLLLIGYAENLNRLTSRLRSLRPTIYCKAESYNRLALEFRPRRRHKP
jgi:chemotaxis protein methyltransferase CheR